MGYDLNVALGLDEMAESSSDSVNHYSAADEEELDVANSNPKTVKKPNMHHMPASGEEAHESQSEELPRGREFIHDLVNDMEKKIEGHCSFPELEQVYIFYCEYGRLKGFSVRKGDQRYIGSTKDVRWKEFVCSSAGAPFCVASSGKVAVYRKQVTRTNCLAKIRVHPFGDQWRITSFSKEHNHQLVEPDKTYLLRSSRLLTVARQSLLEAMRLQGIPVNIACGFMEDQCGGPQNVGVIRKDVYDHLRRAAVGGKTCVNADAVALLEYFNRRSNEEPCFFWKAKYGPDGRLLHFFMRDTKCLTDYIAFGDILLLDTTHKTNRYNLSCAPFVGLNHHSTNVMFGIGFLSNETTETFEWLLDAFLEAMDRKHPIVVFSDQCRALMNAIDSKFPRAAHRLCQWHVNNNAAKHLGSLNGNVDFKRKWHRCMNGVESEKEFKDLWTEMMATHVTGEHEWLENMYSLRHRWASVFSQNIFTAGMHSTSRSEGTNKVLKILNRASTSLYEFATVYEKIQARWRHDEATEDTACIWLPGQFVNKNPMLTQAATIYTRAIYKKFEYQLSEALNVEVDNENALVLADGRLEFKATRTENTTARPRTITFDPITKKAWCSCCMWEGQGILCRHILRVYIVRNVRRIHPDFILKRWTKGAKKVVLKPSVAPTIATTSNTVSHMEFVNIIMRNTYDMASLSKDSIVAQNYMFQLMEAMKLGVLSVLRGGVPPPIPTNLDPDSKDFQFGNPNKVRDRYAEGKKKEVSSTNQKKKRTRKCPGISTKSRKNSRFREGSSNRSAAQINTNLSLDLNDPRFRATQ